MARQLKRIEEANSGFRSLSRRATHLVASVGLLFVLVSSGCASINVGKKGVETASPIDILILTTERATAADVLQRLEGVENSPSPWAGEQPWSRGQLTGSSDGSVYTIVVGPVEAQGDTDVRSTLKAAAGFWAPRYILVLGTTPAVAYDEPLGAVGLVTLICDFELDRFKDLGSLGNCHRPDGGLFAAARSVEEEWETVATPETGRTGCSRPRVLKLAALSGNGDLQPDLVETAMELSEELHRGLIIERQGIFVAQAVDELRHTTREPIGFLMIRGVSEIRGAGARLDGEPEPLRLQKACAARDTADFAVELIRRRWPVSSRTKH